MSTVLELTAKGTDEVIAHACGDCRYVATSRAAAAACCVPWKCDECGKEVARSYSICERCRTEKRKAAEKARFDGARKIPLAEYAGRVLYSEPAGEFLYSEDDYGDYAFEMDGTEEDSYLWACRTIGLSLNAEDIVNAALERDEHHDDACDQVSDIKGLQDLLDGWTATQAVESYFPDYDLAVIMPAPEDDDD